MTWLLIITPLSVLILVIACYAYAHYRVGRDIDKDQDE